MEKPGNSSNSNRFDLLAFGEALLRYIPVKTCEPDSSLTGEAFLRTVSGSELSFCVALAQLGFKTAWVSVLPEGPVGEIIIQEASKKGVDISCVGRAARGQVGIHHVFPEQQLEQYQRSNSAFAQLEPNAFNWASLVSNSRWLLLSGITPLLGEGPLTAWKAAIGCAKKCSVPVCLDLSYQPLLGTLDHLIYTVMPYLEKIDVLVIDCTTASKLFQKVLPTITVKDWMHVKINNVAKLQEFLQCKTLAINCYMPTAGNRQRRFSIVASSSGVAFTTLGSQVEHAPVSDLGWSQVWSAGFMDIVLAHSDKQALEDENTLRRAARQGDLLSALCQNSWGDFSSVGRDKLSAASRALGWAK